MRQGPAGEAQAATDLHHLLSTLRGLPVDPATAARHLEPLAALCRGRFTDPSLGPTGARAAAAAAPAAAAEPASAPNGTARRVGLVDAGAVAVPPAAAPSSRAESDWAGSARGDDKVRVPRAGSPTKTHMRAELLRPAAAAAYSGTTNSGAGALAEPLGRGDMRADDGAHLRSGLGSGGSADPSAAAARVPAQNPVQHPTQDDDPLGAGRLFGSPARPAARAAADPVNTLQNPDLTPHDPGSSSKPPRPGQAGAAAAVDSRELSAGVAVRAPCTGEEAGAASSRMATETLWTEQDSCGASGSGAGSASAGDSRDGAGGSRDGGVSGSGDGGVCMDGRGDDDGSQDAAGGADGGGAYDTGGGGGVLRYVSNASELAYAAADPAQARRGLRRFQPSAAEGAAWDPLEVPADAEGGDLDPTSGSFCIPSADAKAVIAAAADPNVPAASLSAATAAPGRRRLFSEPSGSSAADAARGSWGAAGSCASQNPSGFGGPRGAGVELPEGFPAEAPADDAPRRVRLGRRLTDVFAAMEAGGASEDLLGTGTSSTWSEAHVPPEPLAADSGARSGVGLVGAAWTEADVASERCAPPFRAQAGEGLGVNAGSAAASSEAGEAMEQPVTLVGVNSNSGGETVAGSSPMFWSEKPARAPGEPEPGSSASGRASSAARAECRDEGGVAELEPLADALLEDQLGPPVRGDAELWGKHGADEPDQAGGTGGRAKPGHALRESWDLGS